MPVTGSPVTEKIAHRLFSLVCGILLGIFCSVWIFCFVSARATGTSSAFKMDLFSVALAPSEAPKSNRTKITNNSAFLVSGFCFVGDRAAAITMVSFFVTLFFSGPGTIRSKNFKPRKYLAKSHTPKKKCVLL